MKVARLISRGVTLSMDEDKKAAETEAGMMDSTDGGNSIRSSGTTGGSTQVPRPLSRPGLAPSSAQLLPPSTDLDTAVSRRRPLSVEFVRCKLDEKAEPLNSAARFE